MNTLEIFIKKYTMKKTSLSIVVKFCHRNATLLLADFLQEVSPTTFSQHKAWLAQRAEHYTNVLYDRNRTFKGSKYDIDELLAQTLEYIGEKKEDALNISDNAKVFQKELKI